ncbi:dTMP kinase [Aliidiomarina haloalkalitolerans]|uniref:Thymidylate kinase n=1 Tax=Aliidiomarina haloalkalitolerans TaxID=859059 RepID=A0A432VYG9_9GAMM|nr:dTMP kinase [Aliidiomarina haloalkalitolerans]RUO21708.1 dTMP kinase [Aliidiomarina haloalkalitolerans]
MKGQFIVIEGLEGAGKSTAVNTVKTWVEAHGKIAQLVREPGGTPFAEALRELVKRDWDESITAEAELMLMYAARVQLVENVIKPALARGEWVIGDRHDLSSRAYQGGGRELGDAVLLQLRQLTMKDFQPDLTLYLDIDPALGLQRAHSRGELDRIEKQTLDFFQRTRQRYLEIAASEPNIVVIDASCELEQVQVQLQAALAARWPDNVCE